MLWRENTGLVIYRADVYAVQTNTRLQKNMFNLRSLTSTVRRVVMIGLGPKTTGKARKYWSMDYCTEKNIQI